MGPGGRTGWQQGLEMGGWPRERDPTVQSCLRVPLRHSGVRLQDWAFPRQGERVRPFRHMARRAATGWDRPKPCHGPAPGLVAAFGLSCCLLSEAWNK